MSFVLSWKGVVWCSEVRNAPCSTASFCMAWTTLKDYIYPLTISQIKWFEMKLPNLTKKHCGSFKPPPHFLLHLNAAADTFMLRWWNSYNVQTVQELRKTSRVLLNFNWKCYSTQSIQLFLPGVLVINKLWMSDPSNSPWKHWRGNQGTGP